MARTMTWTDAGGTATIISDGSAGITVRANPVGLEAPSPSNTIDNYIAFDGGVLVNRRRPYRPIALGLYFEHATRVETVIAQAALMLQGPGELEWADGVNDRSLRQVIYETGLDGSGDTNLLQATRVVSLLALDPWWYGPAASTALSVASPTAFDAAISFDAAIPFDGGAAAPVTIDGDTDVYPVITVTGPATTLTVGSGGLSWSISAALISGDVLVVDHRPGSRGPSKNGGLVDWSLLTQASRLFTLAPGVTSVISGSTGSSGATSITLEYEPRFLTP